MKKIIITVLIAAAASLVQAQSYTFLTYNIRYDNPGDGPDRWELRKEALVGEVLSQQPSVAGFQEVLKSQVDFLDKQLKGYQRYGVGREDGGEKGEYSPVYFDTTAFRLVTASTRWLSATPDKPGKGWDAACERIATVVTLLDRKTGDSLMVINTHWDHIGVEARRNSTGVIRSLLSEWTKSGRNAVFMGDLNAEPGTPPIMQLGKFLRDACPSGQNDYGTFNGFEVNKKRYPRIDYIWMAAPGWKVTHYKVLHPKVNGRQVSDHFPVLVKVRF
jgi:endonuclease/exonuclease/phosphatase family metal-dependent hydrolase